MISDYHRVIATLVICTHRRASALRATLENLRQQRVPDGLEPEVLIVENGVADGTREVVADCQGRPFPIAYYHLPAPGKSAALNHAIAIARGEVVLFADDDLRFHPEWLAALALPIASGKCDGMTSRIVIPPHLRRSWMTPYHLAWLGSLPYRDPEHPDEIPGANMAVHRRVFQRVPAYDTELGGGGLGNCEDSLFSRQLIAAGFRLGLAREAPVEHHFQVTKLQYGQWIRNARAAGHSQAYLLHHWYHRSLQAPRARRIYLMVKLALRQSLRPRRNELEEGIPAWEMSYRHDIACCNQYLRERLLARKYDRLGLVKKTPLAAAA